MRVVFAICVDSPDGVDYTAHSDSTARLRIGTVKEDFGDCVRVKTDGGETFDISAGAASTLPAEIISVCSDVDEIANQAVLCSGLCINSDVDLKAAHMYFRRCVGKIMRGGTGVHIWEVSGRFLDNHTRYVFTSELYIPDVENIPLTAAMTVREAIFSMFSVVLSRELSAAKERLDLVGKIADEGLSGINREQKQ